MMALTSLMLIAGPTVAACVQEPTYEQWASTDGASGRINLDDVQNAFKKSKSPSEFEKRVNEIYEGDGIILIRSRQDGDKLTLDAFEDLNNSGDIEGDSDDLLFSIVNDHQNNDIRGHGANGYYHRSFGGGDFLFTYLMLSSFSRGPYYYHTPIGNTATIRANRNNYRSSSTYRSQVSRNSSYFRDSGGFAKSRFNDSKGSISSSRQSYLSRQKSSGAFKNSSAGVRSSWGSRSTNSRSSYGSRRGGGGGFRGFGGSQNIVGLAR